MFASVAMTLGDAFNRRKKLAADLQQVLSKRYHQDEGYHTPWPGSAPPSPMTRGLRMN